MAQDDRQRRAQFDFERILHLRILKSRPEDRFPVTSRSYADLFKRFPGHDAMEKGNDKKGRKIKAGLIAPLAKAGDRVLEIGCGRGDVLFELADCGCECVGLEPSQDMVDKSKTIPGVKIMFGVADKLDFPDSSFDLVFSQQVLEHLHPEDVMNHFREMFRILRPGGTAAIETPNFRTGPQDQSRGFVPVAQGLHLKEWKVPELISQFRQAGFVRVRGLVFPPFLIKRMEKLHRFSRVCSGIKAVEDTFLGLIPTLSLRTVMAKILGLDDIFLFAQKPCR